MKGINHVTAAAALATLASVAHGQYTAYDISNPSYLSSVGSGIDGGETHPLKAGDVVHIPPRTPHQVVLKKGQSIDYVALKVDAQ